MTNDGVCLPEDEEAAACPLCGTSGGPVVGERGRFGMSVRNVACMNCALVYVTPRPTRAAMGRYYAGEYRRHYGQVKYPIPGGGTAGPGDVGYQLALDAWHGAQASRAIALGAVKAGDRVLEVGCRHGRTLELMRRAVPIEAFGLEPGEDEAALARAAGLTVQTVLIEDFAPGAVRFDLVQIFHVLEHLHDPVAALVAMRSWLAPGGRLVVEVPNVLAPYGLLEENFFQNVHLMSFSASTLRSAFARAGLIVRRVIDAETLILVGEVDPEASELPRPFELGRAAEPEQTAAWVAERLATYATLEKLKLLVLSDRGGLDAIHALVACLGRPALVPHLMESLAALVEHFVKGGALRPAALLLLAASEGPHPPEVCGDLRHHAEILAQRLAAAAASTDQLRIA